MILDDLASYLQTRGHGTVGVDIHKGMILDQPPEAVAICWTGGYPPDDVLPDVQVTFQVRIRAQDYALGAAKAWQVFNDLDRPGNRTVEVNGRRMVIRANQPPVFLEQDAGGRYVFVFNITALTSRDEMN